MRVTEVIATALLMMPGGFSQVASPPAGWQDAARAVEDRLRADLADMPLEASRVAGLSQDTLFLQQSYGAGDAPARNMDFYEAIPLRFEIIGGVVQDRTVTLDGEFWWLTAVDQATQERFFLAGFDETTSRLDFGRLVASLKLRFDGEDQVLDIFDYYLKVGKGQIYRSSIPSDELSLMRIVADDFRERYPRNRSLSEFNRWWTQHETDRKKVSPPKARLVSGQYRVSFFRYTDGKVITEEVTFARDGTVVRK